MAKTTRNTVVLMGLTMALLGSSKVADAEDGKVAASSATRTTRVRTENPAIANLIEEASSHSETFRGLLATIEQTDGLVYVEDGKCGHGVVACMPFTIAKAGPSRVLHLIVEMKRAKGAEAMGLIGHELQHAVEVLTDPSVASDSAIYFLYARSNPISGRFETDAALRTGDRVRAEVRQRSAN